MGLIPRARLLLALGATFFLAFWPLILVTVASFAAEYLADPNGDVRGRMINAGILIIDKHGRDNVSLLFPIFENYLNKKASDEEKYDLVREGVVIFTRALAKHLAKDDPKVHAVVDKLLDVLNTPSEAVQRAVSSCLSPLMLSKQMVLFFVAFFGTGNFASIASFEISSVYRFITVFNPFLMAALLIFKLMIPFGLVICAFSAITKLIRVPLLGLYFLAIVFSDVMTIHFFFLVRNTGSWMEIGNSISHFGIVSAQVVFILLLLAVTNIYTNPIHIKSSSSVFRKQLLSL